MAKRDDIKKQLKKQQDEVYGEGTIAGSSPDPGSDDNVGDALEDAVGGKINPGDEFHLADEVMKDEEARKPGINDSAEEEEEDDESEIDPFDTIKPVDEDDGSLDELEDDE